MEKSLYLEICKAIGVRITDALKPENMKQSLETEKSEASEAEKTGAIEPENMKQSLETEKSEASEAEKTDAIEPENMEKSFYQNKYEAFKKDITDPLEPDSLKDKYTETSGFQSVRRLLNSIKNNLPEQAKKNFEKAANVDVFEDFIRVTGCNPDDRNCEWKKVGDFALRLSLGAFDENGCRITPETALKTIFTNLMENLGEYMNSKQICFEVKANNEKNCELLDEFFSKYELIDSENPDSAPFEEGIREYLRSCCQALLRERFDGDGVNDDHTILLNEFRTRISVTYLTKDVAVMILMRGAPTSIWAMKCIQAGISKFEWRMIE